MKRYLSLPLLLLVLGQTYASTLTTPSFVIEIHENCEEGSVGCDNVSYLGTSKKSGKSIKLRGKTMHTLCADGVTPCRFLGYEFRNGATSYQVQENGGLLIMQGKKVLVEEVGTWDW
ncbi:hypothetical protein [Herbaspirillum rhizosphaerae]|uniref:hypothetical protein n=1 Tax=Herbaspirillum rhizosphaerae TaxID=346179 RepID=UPI00067D8B3B|nr:hypothetical protein [Herbaspirillum rhizosphaerae]